MAGSLPCPRAPQLGPPGQASPAAAVTQALAPLPAKMEAPELLRVWVLAGEWRPHHPPWGHGRAGGAPSKEGMGGTPRMGQGMGRE